MVRCHYLRLIERMVKNEQYLDSFGDDGKNDREFLIQTAKFASYFMQLRWQTNANKLVVDGEDGERNMELVKSINEFMLCFEPEKVRIVMHDLATVVDLFCAKKLSFEDSVSLVEKMTMDQRNRYKLKDKEVIRQYYLADCVLTRQFDLDNNCFYNNEYTKNM